MLQEQDQLKRLISTVTRYLFDEGECELVQLLKTAQVSAEEINTGAYIQGYTSYNMIIFVDISVYRKNRSLIENYEKSLYEIIQLFLDESFGEILNNVSIKPICKLYLNWNDLDGVSKDDVLKLIDSVKATMISVSTGGAKIDDVNGVYQSRFKLLDTYLKTLGLINPNLYPNLWDWYGKWSEGDLPSYASRRQFINKLYQKTISDINNSTDEQSINDYVPTGWDRVDRSIYEMKKCLSTAVNEEQFQAIGVLGRETIITVAQQVFDVNVHKTDDGIIPSKTDAKRMLDAYISYRLSGASNDALRKFSKTSIDLSNKLTHDRTATYETAEMCIIAVTATANLVRALSRNSMTV